MKKKDEIILEIADVNFPNKAYGYYEGEKVIVKNAVPGQKVQAQVFKKRGSGVEARLQEVIERSPMERETGMCSHYALCGGCTYQTMRHEEELRLKERQVKRLLENAGICVQSWEGIVPAPSETGYRNKCEFSFGDEYKDGPLALGMHKRGSFYDIVTVADCEIVDADYRLILQIVRDYFAREKVSFFHRMSHEGYLRHLLVRKASRTGEILVALVTTSQDPWQGETAVEGSLDVDALITGFKDLLLSLEQDRKLAGKFAGILHITNDSIADVVQSDRTELLYGQEYFYEELLGLKFKISTFSFFQTNSYSAEVLYQTARDYVGDLGGSDKTVFDLYSGTGTIAQLMAPAAGKVIGVEIVEEAVEAAKKNAAANGLDNCEFIAGDVLKVLDEVEEKPDMIILDPPRDGIHPKALPKIIKYAVDHIVYISCKPTSLVRDLEVFLENGYRVDKAVAVDQFPWTANVECVIMMQYCGKEKKK